MKKYPALLIALLITLLIAGNSVLFSNLNSTQKRTAVITRVIDGDTFVVDNKTTIRLLNVNTPEKSEKGYDEAKNFVEFFENQEVSLIETGTDKYKRSLAKVYTPEYLNLELIKRGLAKKFLVAADELDDFNLAEKNAVENSLGIWDHSQYFSCFKIQIDATNEIAFIESVCGEISLSGFTLADESRKEYKFPDIFIGKVAVHSETGTDNSTDLFWAGQNVWNNDRDTVYLFDQQGKISYHESYGY